MKGIIAAIIVVLAVAGGAFVLIRHSKKPAETTTPTNTSNTNQTTESTPSTTVPSSESNTITYTNDGFSPSTLTVKAGTTITIKNDSSHVLQFASDPHPVHTDDPELNTSTISPGKSTTIAVNKTGSHGYHNHLNPSDTGTLVVQ